MVPTVLMVGESRLALIPEYLNLGSVVVVAPDQEVLRRWQAEQSATAHPDSAPEPGAVVDMSGRQILWQGDSLPLSQLEFRTLSALLAVPGRAISFRELRREGWGDGPEMPVDPYTVKALIQRLRAKIAAVSAQFCWNFTAPLAVGRPHAPAIALPLRPPVGGHAPFTASTSTTRKYSARAGHPASEPRTTCSSQ
jgi:hypothetical protein